MPLVASKSTTSTACSIVSISQDATIGTFPLVLTRQAGTGYSPSSLTFGQGAAALVDAPGQSRLPYSDYSLNFSAIDGTIATFRLHYAGSNLARFVVSGTWPGSYLEIIDVNNGNSIQQGNLPVDGEVFVDISTLTDGVHTVYLKISTGAIHGTTSKRTRNGKAFNVCSDVFTHLLAQTNETKIVIGTVWPGIIDKAVQITFSGTWAAPVDVWQDFAVIEPEISYYWRFAGDVASPIFSVWPSADQALVSPSAGTLTIRPDAQVPAQGGTDQVTIENVLNPPTAPTNLATTLQSAAQLRLDWQHSGANVVGFKVYRIPASGSPIEVTGPGGVASDVRTYTIAGFSYGATYRVVAFNGDGESAGNPEVTAPTATGIIATPTTINLTDGDTSQISVTGAFSSGQSFPVTSLAVYTVDGYGTGGAGSVAVSSSGLVQALDPTQGALIGVSFQGHTAQVTVNVAAPPDPVPIPPTIVYDAGAQRISWAAIQYANEYAIMRNAVEVGRVAASPFSIPVTPDSAAWLPGTYAVTVRSVGASGTSSDSNGAQVTIEAPTVIAPPRNPNYRFGEERLIWPLAPMEPNQVEDQPFQIRSRLPREDDDIAEPEVRGILPRFSEPDPILDGDQTTRSQGLEET